MRSDAREFFRARIEPVHAAAVGAHPQYVQRIGGIRADGEDRWRGERGRIPGVVGVGLPSARGGIEAQQTFHRAHPDHAVLVLEDRRSKGIGIVHHGHGPWISSAGLGARVDAPERLVAAAPEGTVDTDVQWEEEAVVRFPGYAFRSHQFECARHGIVAAKDPVGQEGPIDTIPVLHGHVGVLRHQPRADRRPLVVHAADPETVASEDRIEDGEVAVVVRHQHLFIVRHGQRPHTGARLVVEALDARIVLQQAVARSSEPQGACPVEVGPFQGADQRAQIRV